MKVRQYRKKPVVIEALQFDGTYTAFEALRDWGIPYRNAMIDRSKNECLRLSVETLEGPLSVSKGDYVIKGVEGEFYPCKPDIFNKTYEEVTNASNNR